VIFDDHDARAAIGAIEGHRVWSFARRARLRNPPVVAKRVLVVDDHAGVALALKVAFRRDGRFEVADAAATAAEGVRKLAGHDAVLLDLHLPDLAGPALVQAFRERDSTVPIILHSAVDDTPEVAEVREAVDAIVLKGRVEDVLAALARCTGN
jgi:two-component system, OmpR family, KDP operon response regulator KdpE